MNTDTIVESLVAPLELTNAIVTAAKRVRKSKAAVEPELPSIVDEVNANFGAGNFAQEAIANLSRVFGREFVIEEPEPKVPDTVEPTVPETKAKKPRAKKVTPATTVPDSIVGGAVVDEEPVVPVKKETKPKKTKAKKEPAAAPVVDTDEEEAKQVKPKKTKAKKEAPVVEEPPSAQEPVQPKKKARAQKVKAPTEESKQVKKTKSKKEQPSKEEDEEESHRKVIYIVKSVERPSTPVLVEDDDLPDLETRLSEELEEEELSDIEEE